MKTIFATLFLFTSIAAQASSVKEKKNAVLSCELMVGTTRDTSSNTLVLRKPSTTGKLNTKHFVLLASASPICAADGGPCSTQLNGYIELRSTDSKDVSATTTVQIDESVYFGRQSLSLTVGETTAHVNCDYGTRIND